MRKIIHIYNDGRKPVIQSVRGVCTVDPLNPCWDDRSTDIAGKHWSGGEACAACTAAAKAVAK